MIYIKVKDFNIKDNTVMDRFPIDFISHNKSKESMD